MNLSKKATSKWTGKTWLPLGDSITAVNSSYTSKSYHGYIADKIGCTIKNYGISGTGWRTPSTNGGTDAFYQRIGSLPTSDLITVFGGTNDWAEVGVPMALGAFGDTVASTSLYGAIDNVLSTLITNNPKTTIAVFTPIHRQDAFYNLTHQTTSPKWTLSTAKLVNVIVVPNTANGHVYKCTVAGTTGATEPTFPTGAGATVVDGTVTWQEAGSDLSSVNMQQVADAIIAVANKYGIPALDLYRQGNMHMWNATFKSTFMTDGVHPNDVGHQRMADKILAFMNSL